MLLCSCLIMLYASIIFAQQQFVSVQEAYEGWKQQATKQNNDLEYVMAVKVANVSDKEATLDLLVGGDMAGYRVKMTPVKVNLDQSKEEAGVWVESKSDSVLNGDKSIIFQLTTEISSKANAVEVEFTPETAQKEKSSFSLLVPLSNTSYASVMGSTVSKTTLKCHTVTLSCGNGCSVSRICKYCADGSQRYHGNCTTCTIICSCGACGLQE